MATSIEDSALQNIIFKASHNSYNRDETIAQQLTFNSTAAYQCGCRGIEFDIWRHDDDNPPMNPGYFTVDHTSSFSGETLKYWLDQVKNWHKDNANHDVVWIMLDIKSSHGDSSTFPNQIDSYLTDYFGLDLIASPKLLFPTLSDTNPIGTIVASEGWPPLGTLLGKFIFCLSGNEDWKNVYVNQNPSTRLCFADTDDDQKLGNKRVVYNVEAGHEKTSTFQSLIQKNIFIRVYDTNSNGDWSNATNLGANMLATNKVSNSTWAEVSTNSAFNYAKR